MAMESRTVSAEKSCEPDKMKLLMYANIAISSNIYIIVKKITFNYTAPDIAYRYRL